MSIKTWVLERVRKVGGRSDLPQREVEPPPVTSPPKKLDSMLTSTSHLGQYATLIAAIREELEHFVASHVQLHLAIADHDRFLLTSIGVNCGEDVEARQLLQQFMREFRPEQVKRYLAREVIGALPNASAIDLTQFAGLLDADLLVDESEHAYSELLAALRSDVPTDVPAYQVNIVGRWTELDGTMAVNARAHMGSTLSTPLAGQRCDFDIEDGDGKRRVVLQSVVPGRRYVIGKGEGCDIRINGSYASRRHAEIWFDNGTWRVADAGSTNGIRVESPSRPVERCRVSEGVGEAFVELVDGARIVLSANADGSTTDYPWLALRASGDAGARVTPIAMPNASSKTPITPIHSARLAELKLVVTARSAAGERTLDVMQGALPITVGRSRDQTLVVGRAHELVSGHHLDIIDMDEVGVLVLVHGDNGVVVEGVDHAAGTHFVWKVGQTMLLGVVDHEGPQCSLRLSRRG